MKVLLHPVDAAALATFRVFFGAMMVWEVIRYFQFDWIHRYYIAPEFHFTYEMFPFVAPLSATLMYLMFLAMGISALGIAIGLFYRVSAVLFFVTYTYVFLLDKTQYNNHYYLIILLSFLLVFVDAHRWASVDQKWRPDLRVQIVPFWQQFIFRAQIVIVYFYAAVAKMNVDWLAGQPLRIWLGNRSDYPVVGPIFATDLGVFFFAYGGLLFDLLIGFALLWKRTRLIAFFFLLFFHLTNKWLFSIGIFPYLMIVATIVFVDPDWPRRILKSAPIVEYDSSILPQKLGYSTIAVTFAGVFLLLQILIPFRHWLYPGYVSWTEEGHRFAWHMKLRDKQARIAFTVINPATQKITVVDVSQDLTNRQIRKMAARPDMILQYTHYLKRQWQAVGVASPIIQAHVWASLNGRPYFQLVDPQVNLAEQPQTVFARADWILPLPATGAAATNPPFEMAD